MRPETERRFAESLVRARLVPQAALRDLLVRRQEKRSRRSLPRLLCDARLFDRTRVAKLLVSFRAHERARHGSKRLANSATELGETKELVAPAAANPPPSGPKLASSSPATQGQRLGPYRLLEELGRGANGVVYRAVDERLRREVALKTMPGVVDEAAMQRFVREARASARLRHPGIVGVYGAEVVQGVRVLALELVTGGSLRQKLAEGPLDARQAAEVVRDLALAVQAAHDAGVVHRDLKPANVLLEKDGRPRLTDFGLAKDDQGPVITATGDVMGTPAYMAPEQAEGDSARIGPTTDVWGLGAILYECLAGRPPFAGKKSLDVVRQVMTADPAPPSRVRDAKRTKIHPDLDTIALKCLEKEPARRYARPTLLAEDLACFLAGEPIAARPPGALESVKRRAARHKVALALAVLGVLGAGTLALVLVRGELARREARASVQRFEDGLAGAGTEANVEASVAELARDASDETVLALGVRLDAVSEALRDQAVRAILHADALGAPIGGLEAAARRWTDAARDERLPRAEADALADAEKRLLAARRSDEPARSLRELVGRAQEAVGGARLRFARVACEALGRIGRSGAVPALGRHLDAEQDQLRALHAANALLRIGDLEGVRHALHAQDRFGRSGPFAERLGRDVDFRRLDSVIVPKTARDFRDRAELREGMHRLEEAVADFTKAIELDPTNAAAFQSRGQLHRHFGRKEPALADFARAIALEPTAERYVARALARTSWDDVAGALADASHGIELAPADARGWSIRAWAKLKQKDLDGAIADARHAIELDPRFADAYMNEGHALREKGDLTAAFELGRRATELDPGNVSAWINLGQTCHKRTEYKEALACYSRAVELDPTCAEAWATRGTEHCALDQWKLALEDLDRSLALDPRRYEVWVSRASIRAPLGDLPGAIADCTRAIELAPSRTEAWINRAALKLNASDLEGAFADCNSGLERSPDDARLLRMRGFVRAQRGDGDALADLGRSIQIDPSEPDSWRWRGLLHSTRGSHDLAASDFARAAELSPKDATNLVDLAREKLALGDAAGAIETASAAITIAPSKGLAWAMRGFARLRKNDADGVKDLERALELEPKAKWAAEARAALEKVNGR